MPRPKKSSSKGRGGRQGYNGAGRTALETPFDPQAGTKGPGARRDNATGAKNFSLQSEALNTQRHGFSWTSDQRLRNTRVDFVSGVGLEPSIPIEPESAMADMSLDDTTEAPRQVINHPSTPAVTSEDGEGRSDSFFIDTVGSQQIKTGFPPPQILPSSPTPSDSSEEFIVFKGRNRPGRELRTPREARTRDPYDAKIKIIEDRIHDQENLLAEVKVKEDQGQFRSSSSTEVKPDIALNSGRRNGSSSRSSRQKQSKNREEQALIADYIANMETESMDPSMFLNQRELGGTESDVWQETDTSSGEPHKTISNNGWEQSDLVDFDGLSTSDGEIGHVQEILSKRNRPSGPQYLVVWERHTVDDARWVPRSSLTHSIAVALVKKFEAKEKLMAKSLKDDPDSDLDPDDKYGGSEGDNINDYESSEFELSSEKKKQLSDAKIAQLLTKQEELGMGSDGLIFFDDSADENEDNYSPSKNHSKRIVRGQRGAKRPRGDFPSASVLADAYDGFDVLDFERPSLKKKPKGRKGKPVFDLSDSELEASMEMAWSNDRLKKKEKKEAREEMRAQGLLGQKHKPDLKVKYKEGMSIHAVKDELKIFLLGKNTTLALPPMDKADRKIVHELANAFNLKSKSAGTGSKRYPLLHRTTRTLTYVESTFVSVYARLTRRYLPRMDVKGKQGQAVTSRSGRGFSSAAVSYRDGDIVGGSAPELGTENKGRAMLEKMGWSTGTALGALNNKGILQPVSHVVKTTKAGLG